MFKKSMGNLKSRNTEYGNHSTKNTMSKQYVPVDDFEFLGPLEEEDSNGLFFNGTFIPEEILINILSFVPPHQLLPLTLVCKKWCNIIKSEILWMEIYNRGHSHKAKLLPWYVYYLYYTTDNFKNLLKNGNGQEGYSHWKIMKNLGDEFRIENTPCGSEPLPQGVPDFNGHTSCFATSYYECNKIQEINLENKRLFRYVINKYTPHIYVSEWVAARWDCGCKYKLTFSGHGEDYKPKKPQNYMHYLEEDEDDEENSTLFEQSKTVKVEQWAGKTWEKVEILIEKYPKNTVMLLFEHEGCDTKFWKGHYGSKMAGGVVKFLFESIKPENDEPNVQSKENK